MNIFVLDEIPAVAAQMLCDCHLRKMCVETAHILSGVMLRRGMALLDGMPKPQNINHPVIVAAGKNKFKKRRKHEPITRPRTAA